MRNDPPIRIGGLQSKALFQFTMQSPDTQNLFRSAVDFEAKMRALAPLADVSSDLQIRNPQVSVVIARDSAYALGITDNQIVDDLYSDYGLRQVYKYFVIHTHIHLYVYCVPLILTAPTPH